MKILIFYTYNKGLLSEFFQELSEKLYQDGFEVHNFYLKHQKAAFQQNGVSIHGDRRGGYVHNYRKIYRIIKEQRPDVVISNFNYINPAILFGKLFGVKLNIAWFHTAFGHAKPNKLRVLNKSFYLNMADIVFANSKLLQNEMHTIYRVPKQKIESIPFWTNIANYQLESKSEYEKKNDVIIKIGCPGRLMADKNHALVIKALYYLTQSQQKPIRLYIAGTGPNRKTLQQLVTELKVESDVEFLGLLNVQEMAAFYKEMDMVVLPSFHEAFGLVFIEAIALDTTVLVSNAFGALGFIDKKRFPLDAFTFDPYNQQDLNKKLEDFIIKSSFPSTYFKSMYEDTFEKKLIYNRIKAVILNRIGNSK